MVFGILLLTSSVWAQEQSELIEMFDSALEPLRSELAESKEEIKELRKELGQRDRISKITMVTSVSGGILFALTLYSLMQVGLRRKVADIERKQMKVGRMKVFMWDMVLVMLGFGMGVFAWWMLEKSLL